MWPVNITGKMKGWPVNSPISPDIVCWPAVISSPALDSRNMRTTATIQFNFKFFFNLDTDRSDLTQKILSTFDKLKKINEVWNSANPLF